MLKKIIFSVLTTIFLLFAYSPITAFCGENSPRTVWQVTGLGKPSDLSLGPNGLFYLSSGNKLTVVDGYGRKLWETARTGGDKSGRPVFDARGSIFFPGASSVQEIKLNGGAGWNFTVYQDKSNKALLTFGPGGLLYLPLPSGLYALETEGRLKWMMRQWDSGDVKRTQVLQGREVLACAGNDRAVFVVTGNDSKGRGIVAVSGDGKVVWRYWLGDVKEVNMAATPDGKLFVSVNPAKIERSSRGKVYAFDCDDGSKPLWSYSVGFNDLTAPTLSGHGLLYFCAGGTVFALNQADGREEWRKILSNSNTVTQPVVDEKTRRVYLGIDDKRLMAFDSQGRLDWTFNLDGKVACLPMLFSDGSLFVATDRGSLYKIKDE